MEKITQNLRNFKRSVKEIHTKKPQIEFFTALLTIPVLLTVIILNINNLKGSSDKKASPTENKTIIITQPEQQTQTKEVIVTKEACTPGIGTISISYPDEGDTVSDNPVAIDISYDDKTYCSVIWSYRINGGSWSSYDDRSIALYNLPQGNVKFELRVKSAVNSESKTLTRNFVYNGASPTPTTSPSVSQ